MNYFYSSFNSSDISLRYLILFSSLESLLITSKKNITENLARRTSKILNYGDDKKEKEVYEKLKTLYNIRSKYIHGTKRNIITIENERELRNYVRETLIIYWMYASCNSKLGSKQIIKNLDANVEFDFQTKMVAKYLRTENFAKTYSEACEEISEGIMNGKFKITEMNNGKVKSIVE